MPGQFQWHADYNGNRYTSFCIKRNARFFPIFGHKGYCIFMRMSADIQPILQDETVLLEPLREEDFEALYRVASDPKIWEQHPNKDRWKHEVFEKFFRGAMESKGAFKIIDKRTGEIAGSTRFYNYNQQEHSIMIGYTFYATRYWGKGINPAVKHLLLQHIFPFVTKVRFQIGATNFRSQTAIQRLGARKIGEETIAYYGEAPKLNFVYELTPREYANRASTPVTSQTPPLPD